MAETTKIEWCDSTWNPWIGCTRVSPACDHCYAAVSTPARVLAVEWGPGAQRRRTSPENWKLPLRWEREHEAFESEHGRRRRVFCASLADVFDTEVDPQWRHDLFALIRATPHLDWLLLTKRIGNAMKLVDRSTWDACPNIWLGATVVTQEEADRDVPKLLAVPAAKRFLSIEPMLGPINLCSIRVGRDDSLYRANALTGDGFDGRGLDWIICGGESGPHARPMHPEWARSLRDQCRAAGVPFFMKQMGGARDKRGALDDLPADLRAREFPSVEVAHG